MRRIFLVLTIIASLIGITLPARAQNAISPSLSVNPGLSRETVAPGETKKVEIWLGNLGADPIPLSATTFNIAKISDAGAPEFTRASVKRSASDWLTLDRPDLILAGNSEQKLIATITTPKDAAPGGYSAAIIFQAKLPSYYFDLDANTRILPALSVSFLISVTGSGQIPSTADIKIKSFEVPKVVVSGPVPVVTEVSNPTDYFIYADGDVTIAPAYGDNKTINELSRSVIMPDSSRKYVNAYSDRIWPGVYTATVKLGEGNSALVASAKFVAIPWQFIVIVFTLLIIILALVSRRRLKRAMAALTGKE